MHGFHLTKVIVWLPVHNRYFNMQKRFHDRLRFAFFFPRMESSFWDRIRRHLVIHSVTQQPGNLPKTWLTMASLAQGSFWILLVFSQIFVDDDESLRATESDERWVYSLGCSAAVTTLLVWHVLCAKTDKR